MIRWFKQNFIFLIGLNGVRLVNVNVPSYRFRGENAVLKCIYDLEGEQLYSVKWYKDGSEFFRYIPGDPDQRITTFSLPGVTVDVRIDAYMEIQTLNYIWHTTISLSISNFLPLTGRKLQSKSSDIEEYESW